MKLFFLFIFLNLVYQTSYVLYLAVPLLSEIVFFSLYSRSDADKFVHMPKEITAHFDCMYEIFFHI